MSSRLQSLTIHSAFSSVLCILLFLFTFLGSSVCQQLITCGDDQVIIFDVKKSQDTIPHIVWQWQASEAEDLPPAYRKKYFRSIDECKCVNGGNQILMTSSSSGVALLEIESKKVLFYAQVGNAHSAEMLPRNRIAVMGSTNESGNRIVLFDMAISETPIFHDSIYSGHGVVWDRERGLLYTLGFDELRAYSLTNWDTESPSLTSQNSWTIPGESGHDLSGWPQNPNKLILSEHESSWVFDKKQQTFEPFTSLEEVPDVKAITIHPNSNRLAYIKAETSWWSERVYLQDPRRYFTFPGMHLYKVRWLMTR